MRVLRKLLACAVLALTAAAGGGATARAQDLALVVPDGGEAWDIGTRQQIRWAGAGRGNVRIELSRDGGLSFETLFANVPNDGVEEWRVTGPASSGCFIRITELQDERRVATSRGAFTVVGLTVLAPNGGDVWVIGSQRTVTWAPAGVGNVTIELSRDGGILFETIVSNTPNDGAHVWTVAGPVASACLVRITRLDDPTIGDTSDGLFLISATPGVTVTAPAGGEVWTLGSHQHIRWSGLGGGRVTIELSRDGTATWEVLFASTPDDGVQAWLVAGPPTTNAVVRVSRLAPPLVSDISDAPFEISPDPLVVTGPRGGEDWVIGTQQELRWSGPGLGYVRIELSRDLGGSWETLYEGTRDDGVQFWTVTGPPTTAGLVRVTSLEDLLTADVSDAPFTISRGALALTAPNGGEAWPIGAPRAIAWKTTTAGNLAVELTRDGGESWETLFPNTANDGSVTWTVTGPVSNACRMRLRSWQDSSLVDESERDFRIVCPPATFAIAAGQERSARLAATDCESPQRPASRYHLYTFDMPADGLVSVDLRSGSFDPYVMLLDPDGRVVAENDDFGSRDARLDSIELRAGGPYAIQVTTSRQGEVGEYRVALTRFDVELLGPAGGEVWRFGEFRWLSWRTGAPGEIAEVTLFRHGAEPGAGERLAAVRAGSGAVGWTVTPPAAGLAVFQVCIPWGSRGVQVCDVSGPVTLEPCVPGVSRSCYTGPLGTLGLGSCAAGTQSCDGAGVYVPCHGEVHPTSEVCGDRIDQDCDGADLRCVPCPGRGDCDDGDPCTADACVEGECRHEGPSGLALVGCRVRMLKEALAAVDTLCEGGAALAIGGAPRRKLDRMVGGVEKAAERASSGGKRRCIAQLAAARAKVLRVRRRLQGAAARGALCEAGATLLAERSGDLSQAIVAASTCKP